MKELVNNIQKLKQSEIKQIVQARLKEFQHFSKKNNDDWFSELCFCILAANSKQETAQKIQEELGSHGLLNYSQEQIKDCIIKYKHRFHNNKSKFISEARKFSNIKNIVLKLLEEKGLFETRVYLVKNIKGIGYKEGSHFLRNVGYNDLAILDRHILNLMEEYKLIEKPKTLTPKIYFKIEKRFQDLASEVDMEPGELDLYMWYLKTNTIKK